MTDTALNNTPTATPASIPERRLWFEVAGTCVAWHTLGLCDALISWRACVHEEQFGGASAHPGAHAVYFLMWAIFFGITILAGLMSYRTWHRLSGKTDLLRTDATERKEFMSLAGVFISVTLGCGVIWLGLPLFLLQMCERTR